MLNDLQFSLEFVPNALWLMLMGMIGIFVVMLVIYAAVALLNRFAKDKKPQDEAKDETTGPKSV